MSTAFPITGRSLGADRGAATTIYLLAGLVVIGAWLAWAVSARITRYEVSDSARLEVSGAASPIESSTAGTVKVSRLVLGQRVAAGQILVELDDEDQRLAWKQERTHQAELEPQLAALRLEVDSETAGQRDEQQVLVYSRSGAEAQVRQAKIDADLAEREAQRAEKMHSAGLIPEADLEKAEAVAESRRAQVRSQEQAAGRLSPEMKVRATDRMGKQRQILTEIAKIEADIATSNAALERLRYEMERRKLRATVAGVLTECAVLHAGAHINEGQPLGVVLPDGKVQVVADFDPAAAFGKLHEGQSAAMRLNGFPWAQFGVLPARVSRVAGEIRHGKVRVELAVSAGSNPRIPLQHGLPGSVEVEVERITPAALLLRSAGQTLGAR